MFVGTVAFEFLAKASSDFRREMEEMMAEKEKKERKKKGEENGMSQRREI